MGSAKEKDSPSSRGWRKETFPTFITLTQEKLQKVSSAKGMNALLPPEEGVLPAEKSKGVDGPLVPGGTEHAELLICGAVLSLGSCLRK